MESKRPFHGYVYKITSNVPELPGCYIGQTYRTVEARWRQHCNAAKYGKCHIGRLIQQHGKDRFSIACIGEAFSKADLDALEKTMIQKHDSIRHGFNHTTGGQGVIPTEKVLRSWQINSYKNKPVLHYETGVQYISGQEASRALGLHGSDITQCCKLKLRQVKGQHFVYPDIPIERYLAYWDTGIVRNKAVVCITTGETYGSVLAASRATGASRRTIEHMCKGMCNNRPRKTNLLFAYVGADKSVVDTTRAAISAPYRNRSCFQPVTHLPTGVVYPSIRDASRETGVCVSVISAHSNGRVKARVWQHCLS